MNIEEKVCDSLIDMMEEMPMEKIRVTGLAERAEHIDYVSVNDMAVILDRMHHAVNEVMIR